MALRSRSYFAFPVVVHGREDEDAHSLVQAMYSPSNDITIFHHMAVILQGTQQFVRKADCEVLKMDVNKN